MISHRISNFVSLLLILFGCSLGRDLFLSPSYLIILENMCPEGYVTCDSIDILLINRKTKSRLSTLGTTSHIWTKDKKVPGKFIGYEFRPCIRDIYVFCVDVSIGVNSLELILW